jgi:hypothetical protein
MGYVAPRRAALTVARRLFHVDAEMDDPVNPLTELAAGGTVPVKQLKKSVCRLPQTVHLSIPVH